MSILQTDIQAPFDPTGYVNLTAAQLLQLVAGASPQTDKGIIVATSDAAGVPEVPDASVTTKWKKYIWLRIGAVAATPYIWNDAGSNHDDGFGNNILKWYTIAASSIGIGTITNAMIANNAVDDRTILSVDISKVSGYVAGGPPSGAAGGSLAGTYPNPTIATNGVVTASITDLNVTNAKLEAASTTAGIDAPTKIKPSGTGLAVLRTNLTANAVEYVAIDITEMANPASAADVGKIVRVKSPYTDGFELATPYALLPYALLKDVKANNTAGGTFNSAAWQTRDIAEIADTEGFVAVAANQFVLSAGTYRCYITCPAFYVSAHQARLFNTTSAATVLAGTSSFSNTNDADMTHSIIAGVFTIAAAQTLEIQHQCAVSVATAGFGPGSNFGESCVFTVAEFWKLA